MQVLATYGIKGGVGKTSAAVNLAALAAADGNRTLLWDLDPQGAAGFLLQVKPKIKGGSAGLLAGRRELDGAIKATAVDGLDLLPADVTARSADRALDEAKRPTRQLAKLLKPLAQSYDLVVLDCPPGLSLLSENVFDAADLLLVPLLPAPLSVRTLAQIQEFLASWEGDRPAVSAFFSMVDGRKSVHTAALATPPERVLTAAIPAVSSIERMGVARRPVVLTEPTGRAALAYQALWRQVQTELATVASR
ncbi:MAG: AAA family ATPase [Mycobacteriales bacterium]